MKAQTLGRTMLALLVATLLAAVWGSVVQTQYNLQALASLGVDVGDVRLGTTARDVFSGFTPTYGGYVVLPALIVAFLVAWLIARARPAWRTALFAIGGYVAVLLAIPLVNVMAPVALLVGASRAVSAVFLMAIGGLLGGLLFAWMTRPPRDDVQEQPPAQRATRATVAGEPALRG